MSTRKFERVVEALRSSGRPFVIATVVRTVAPTSAKAGDRAVVDSDGSVVGWVGGGCALTALKRNAAEALADGRTRLVRISRDLDQLESGIIGHPMTCPSGGTLDIFIEPVMPRKQLVVVGRSAIARALCSLAPKVGFDVVMAAPGGHREEFSDARDWLEDIDEVAGLTPRPDAVLVATQGSGDARGLGAAIESGAAYVGFIASPKKSARLKQSLKKRGYDEAAVDAIDAPAGMDIGARTPEEVALSVLAEILQRRKLAREVATGNANERTNAG